MASAGDAAAKESAAAGGPPSILKAGAGAGAGGAAGAAGVAGAAGGLQVPGSGGGGGGSSLLSPRSSGRSPAAARPAPSAAELLQRVGVSGGSTLSPSRSSKWGVARTSVLFRGLGGLGTSYFLEKQAVVIDFGHAYTKVGFATESRPRHIFASPEIRAWRRQGPSVSTTACEDEWIDILDRLLSKVFFYYLSVSPKDRRVVVCDSAHAPAPFRAALVHVLFRRLAVPAVSFVADLVLPLYLTGLSSGIVIDCGHEAMRVMATFAGVPVLSALSAAACGGRRAHRRLGASLRARLPEGARGPWLEEEAVLEDIAVRAGYVAANPGEPALSLMTDKAMPFAPPDREPVQVPPECRWQPFEVFFAGAGDDGDTTAEEGDEGGAFEGWCDCSSLPEAFVQTVSRCPVDVRAAVVQNVVVCGGCAALRGLLPRLALELRAALEREPRTATLARRLLFTPLDFAPVSAVWTGGAVFAALEGAGDYTREDYERGHPLPDWAREGFV